ncbi:hypothetical protein [Amycolatopsis rifamycinica]|uniref:Uncharacterized protein n=1 Tax=Amycolatopsis rifamycinica TaxID=287986 RepID=A0A066U6Q7_9PSEU|nr:hypothetical protein [Amycolatopsis rifamycinica]KDN23141.1 hypothetical protein DV20_05335 [Amycolatopsis rifamycinica]
MSRRNDFWDGSNPLGLLVWLIVLIGPITVGAYLGRVMPGWCGPAYGLIIGWLATALSGNSRYRWVVGGVALVVATLSWYLSRVASLD